VVFDAPDVTPESAYLIADAASVTAEAIAGLDKKTRDGLKLNRVVYLPGHAPAAKFSDGVLQITVAPNRGVAGRPSSRRIDVVMRR
jgi:HSP20 family molecular chaperone IbpA